jgi:hypothetical protein
MLRHHIEEQRASCAVACNFAKALAHKTTEKFLLLDI